MFAILLAKIYLDEHGCRVQEHDRMSKSNRIS